MYMSAENMYMYMYIWVQQREGILLGVFLCTAVSILVSHILYHIPPVIIYQYIIVTRSLSLSLSAILIVYSIHLHVNNFKCTQYIVHLNILNVHNTCSYYTIIKAFHQKD